MYGNVVTILFLLNTLFSHVELRGHGFTEVTECPKSQSEVKVASDRLRCGNDTDGNNQYMCLRFVNSCQWVEFCNDHYEWGIIHKGFTSVTECPKGQREIREASDRLRCGNDTNRNNRYMCLRYDIHSLLEFCYDGGMGIVNKGNCLEISEGELKNHSCYYFLEGCPETKFWFNELHKYPAIKNIVTRPRWDVSHVDCAKQRDCASAFGFFSIGFWIGILLSLSPCFVAGFIKAKQRLKGGKWSPQSPDLFSVEAGVYTLTQFEPSSPPPAPPPPPSNT